MIRGTKNLSYPERLKAVNLPTLAFRRLRGDMIQVYNSGAGKGARGGSCPPPMLKKMVLVILPNSMRKLGGGCLSISDVKKS